MSVTEQSARSRRLMGLFLALLALVIGQGSVFSILPPLAREVGMSTFEVGLVVTLSSAVAFLCGPWWGRRVSRIGSRRVILEGLWGSFLIFVLFGIAGALALGGALGATWFFAVLAIGRGLLFGIFLAAVIVASYAAVPTITAGEKERVRGFALIQGANGTGKIAGPLIGGLLAGFSFLWSFALIPLFVLVGIVAVTFVIPADRESRAAKGPAPKLKFTDARLRFLLLTIFIVLMPLAISQITVGFVVQDNLRLSGEIAASWTGVALGFLFAALTTTQLVIVPALGLRALTLVMLGCALAAVGLAGLVVSHDKLLLAMSLILLGIGSGFSQSGAIAAPSLVVNPDEQGAVAGLVASTNTLAFTVGPAGATFLYEIHPASPYLITAFMQICLVAWLTLSHAVRG